MKRARKSKGGGGGKPPREMVARRLAAEATARAFDGHPFEWGAFDCAKMVLSHLQTIGAPIDIAAAGSWHDPKSARRALKRMGFDTLDAVLDAHFKRIPAAYARLGDVVSFEADHALGGLGIHLGVGSVMCYHEDAQDGPIAGRLLEAKGAWRVIGG